MGFALFLAPPAARDRPPGLGGYGGRLRVVPDRRPEPRHDRANQRPAWRRAAGCAVPALPAPLAARQPRPDDNDRIVGRYRPAASPAPDIVLDHRRDDSVADHRDSRWHDQRIATRLADRQERDHSGASRAGAADLRDRGALALRVHLPRFAPLLLAAARLRAAHSEPGEVARPDDPAVDRGHRHPGRSNGQAHAVIGPRCPGRGLHPGRAGQGSRRQGGSSGTTCYGQR